MNTAPIFDAHARRLAVSIFALSTTAALAAEPKNITQGELALTPAFCQDVQTINGWGQHSNQSPRAPMWISQMGKTFWSMHHYCWALINIHRSRAAGQTAQERMFKVQSAIADYYYVVENATPDFVLLPEVFHLIGEAHAMVNEFVRAIEAYERSKRIKPDYWPPYEGHAKVLEKLGKKADAREVIESGLRAVPGEPRLLVNYSRLGGQVETLPAALRERPKAVVTPAAASQAASSAE